MKHFTIACAVGSTIAISPPALAEEISNPLLKGNLAAYALDRDEAVRVEPASEPRRAVGEGWLDYNLRYIPTPDLGPYSFATFADQAEAVKWDWLGAMAVSTIEGVTSWDWGNTPFHFNNEGFFGKHTGSLGMDKLGHSFSAYLYSEFFADRIAHKAGDLTGAALTGALLSMTIMTYIEVFDGFSDDHGFSYEDMIFDGLGASFSVLRNTVPGLHDKLDYRMEYLPSGNQAISPLADYSGQKYVLALKLSAFEPLEDSPLRFFELQAGYFARGFTHEEREHGDQLRREPYLAVGLNLSELLLSGDEIRRRKFGKIVRRSLEYIQVPYTYIATEQD